MKKIFLAIFAIVSMTQMNAQNNPLTPANMENCGVECVECVDSEITDTQNKNPLLEIGLVFPVFSDGVRDFMTANNVQTNPLASGFGTGVQFAVHSQINDRATLGGIVNATTFISSGDSLTQLYQTSVVLAGRAHVVQFGKSSVFAEIGIGPEFAAYSLKDGAFKYQVSLTSRFGVGYRYTFGNNLGLLASAVLSPDFGTTDPTRNLKVILGMVW